VGRIGTYAEGSWQAFDAIKEIERIEVGKLPRCRRDDSWKGLAKEQAHDGSSLWDMRYLTDIFSSRTMKEQEVSYWVLHTHGSKKGENVKTERVEIRFYKRGEEKFFTLGVAESELGTRAQHLHGAKLRYTKLWKCKSGEARGAALLCAGGQAQHRSFRLIRNDHFINETKREDVKRRLQRALMREVRVFGITHRDDFRCKVKGGRKRRGSKKTKWCFGEIARFGGDLGRLNFKGK